MPAERSLVDSHVHWVALGERPEQGWLSPRLRRGWAFRAATWRLGVAPGDLLALARAYQARLAAELAASRRVRAAVILALDGVYDHAGRFDLERTSFYVPNDAVFAAARSNPAFLPGASVNPARRDALEELERVAAAGAVLIKWLPNAQEFDPADAAHRPFYRALARLGLPLLVHTGVEFAVPSRSQRMGHPARWRTALDEGVTVIAAHGASSGLPLIENANPAFLALVERHANLFADAAALSAPARARAIRRLARHGEGIRRLTFATDYPIPCLPEILLARGDLAGYRAARAEPNYFDRQVRVLAGLGWEPSSEVFERLLRALPQRG